MIMKNTGIYYYNSVYNREIFEADYAYRVSEAHPGAELEIFVTYKITIRNQSQGIIDTINEVVDYYDNEYKYRSDLSWVTYDDNAFRDEEYYKTIHTETLQMSNAKPVNSSEEKGKVYIKGLKDKKLETGEVEYIYLTFQVKKDNNGIILDKYYRREQNLDENFIRIKAKYDLLYKEYEIDKTNRHHKWIAIIIGIIIAINLIKLWMSFK